MTYRRELGQTKTEFSCASPPELIARGRDCVARSGAGDVWLDRAAFDPDVARSNDSDSATSGNAVGAG